MRIKRTIIPAIIFILLLTHLTGCGQAEKAKEDLSALETSAEAESTYIAPKLPASGQSLSDFIPADWTLLDSVELDFNEDDVTDYVAVLEAIPSEEKETWRYPRILFAIASDKSQYRLDFQDINLIRTRSEGGIYGDPYLPMTADGASFTTNFYGGSAWRWAEAFTYTYRDGIWYQTATEDFYGYGSYITDYSQNDYDRGIGIRKKRSSNFRDMERQQEEEPDFDIIYELPLDDAPTLYQAGMRWWLAPDRITDWNVLEIEYAEGISLSEDLTELPQEDTWSQYCDENGMLYTFETDGKYYLAMYHWESHVLSILAEAQSVIDKAECYEDKIYYSTEITDNITYKEIQDGKESVAEAQDCIGMNLNRINMDGSQKEVIFEYLYPDAGQEIKESRPPYLSLIYEISGQEIVIEVYNGDEPQHFYRMNLDGSGLQLIGQVPKSEQ